MDQYIRNYNKGQSRAPDFSFAFNDSNFSDRVLQIQVLPDSQGDGFHDDMLDSITDCKRKNENPTAFSNSNMILLLFFLNYFFQPLPCRPYADCKYVGTMDRSKESKVYMLAQQYWRKRVHFFTK
jgi:hypothetical protein